ncbi:endonuclease MutS2 [Paenibacillus tarimensis]
MNEQTMTALEYEKVREMLKAEAVSPAGTKLIEQLGPSADFRRVTALQNETAEALRLIDAGSSIPLSTMEGIDAFMALLGKGRIYSEQELGQLAEWLQAVRQMKRYMQTKQTTAPTLSAYSESMFDCKELRDELDRCLRYGAVTDQASPQLADIRRHLARCEDQIRRKVDQVMNKHKSFLQESIVSQRRGHFVLAVKREYRKRVAGTVWDESSSGQTLFVEPAEVSTLQEEWNAWKADEGREISIILARLSTLAEQYRSELQQNAEAMATFDFIIARGKLAARYGGRKVNVVQESRLRLVCARHPLLGKEAVPLHVEIGGETKQLIITGPNTGGKTVALKTIGLLTLMVQSGLLIPAQGESEIGLFDHLFADVGDGQSLSQSLSTFSAHISAICEMLNHADGRTLILLDEMAAGTDPSEGIALSVAILEELLERGAVTVATTHFNEIKRYAAVTPGCQNARMAFDADTLQPLYRLEIGEAGESHAFTIARKYGLPERVLSRAAKRLSGAGQVQLLIEPLEEMTVGRQSAAQTEGKSGRNMTREAAANIQPNDVSEENRRELQPGDCVWIIPLGRTGIVYRSANERGEVVVQVKKEKMTFNRKRLSLYIPKERLYPGEDYDLDIVFESVENRKARKLMSRKYIEDLTIVTPPEDE